MDVNLSKSASFGSLTDSDSAYGTESQLSRVDSSETLLTDTESESTSSSVDFGARGQHPSASTVEEVSRGSHHHKDGDEDENHEENVALKVNKRTGDITVQIEGDRKYKKFSEENQDDHVDREGVRVERGLRDIGGATVDSVSHFKTHESDSIIQRYDDKLREKTKEVLTSSGENKKLLDQDTTSGGHFEAGHVTSQSEDTDICVQTPEGEQKMYNVKTDFSDEDKHIHDRSFREQIKEEEKDGQVVKRVSDVDFEASNKDLNTRVDRKEVTEEDNHIVSEKVDKSEQLCDEKSKQTTSSEIGSDGTLMQKKASADQKNVSKSHESVSKQTQSTGNGTGSAVTNQVKSSSDHSTSKDTVQSNSAEIVDPSGLIKKSSNKQQSLHSCSEKKSEAESKFESSSEDGGKSGKSNFKSSSQQSGHLKHETKSSSSSVSSSSSSSASDSKSIKPILLKQPERHGEKRPFNVDGSPRLSKKVHFDSKVEVQGLDARESSYTQKLAAEAGAAISTPSGAAPLCTMSELVNSDSSQSMKINRHVDISRRANEGKDCVDSVGDDYNPGEPPVVPNQDGRPKEKTSVSGGLSPSNTSLHKQALSKPTRMTPLDSLSQLAESLAPSNLSHILPPGECSQDRPRLILYSQGGSTGVPNDGRQAYKTADPPLSAANEPVRSVTTPNTFPGVVDDIGEGGGGSGTSLGQTQSVSLKQGTGQIPSDITPHDLDTHTTQHKPGQCDLSGDDGPATPSSSSGSVSLSQHGSTPVLIPGAHIAIGQDHLTKLTYPEPHQNPPPLYSSLPDTQLISRPVFSKLDTAVKATGPVASCSESFVNNISDLGSDSSLGIDQWSVSGDGKLQASGSSQTSHVASEVEQSLSHGQLQKQSTGTGVSANGQCSGSVSGVCGLSEAGQGLDSGSKKLCTEDNEHDSEQEINLEKPDHGLCVETSVDNTERGQHVGYLDVQLCTGLNTGLDRDDTHGTVTEATQISEQNINVTDSKVRKYQSGDTDSVTIMDHHQSTEDVMQSRQDPISSLEPTDPQIDISASTESSESMEKTGEELSPDMNVVLTTGTSFNKPEENQLKNDPDETAPSAGYAGDSQSEGISTNDSVDQFSCDDSNMDKKQHVGEAESVSITQPDASSYSEMERTETNIGDSVQNKDDQVIDKSGFAPLACDEEDADEGMSECAGEIHEEQKMEEKDTNEDDKHGFDTPEPISQHTDESDPEMTCLDDIGAEGQWDSYAETDFTEDSEQTFVMNMDGDDDMLDSFMDEDFASKDEPIASNAPVLVNQSDSITDKLKMISQSGVVSGRVSLKTMLEQRQKCDVVKIQDLSPIIEHPTSPHKPDTEVLVIDKQNLQQVAMDTDPISASPTEKEKPKQTFELVTMEIPITIATTKQEVECTDPQDMPIKKIVSSSGSALPLATVQSQSMVAILDVAGIGDEVNMSTLERKRKRAKSEEKTSSSRGVHAETQLSQQAVDNAMYTLTQSSEDSLRPRPESYHSQHPQSNRRRYDWNTYHFFPDVHDLGIPFIKRRSHESIYSQYIEEDWLHDDEEPEVKDMIMESKLTNQENQENIPPPDNSSTVDPIDPTAAKSSSSSEGDESPKVWRKNPLLVRRKKKSERRLSAEIRFNSMTEGVDPETPEVGTSPEYGSPSLRKREGSPRSRRSPRRLSNPNQNKIPRRNSDLIQEKVEKFQELQRRRKALESTSEESLALPKKQGRRLGHRHSDLGSYVKDGEVYNLKNRAHSQEDIRYESEEQFGMIQSEISHRPEHARGLEASPRIYKPHQPPAKPVDKSQYDFRSFETKPDRSIQQNDLYSPQRDHRTALVGYRNISSSFENIYDAVDLSMYSPEMDMDVGQYMEKNMAEARRRYQLYKLQQMETAGQSLPSEVQVNIDARHFPARVTVDPTHARDISVTHLKVQSKDPIHDSSSKLKEPVQLQTKKLEHSSEGSQPGTPTSPVWYVPKLNQQYDSVVNKPEAEKRALDAKTLIEEEKRKFQDYKREYVRRISERDSTSGTSGDEQRKDNEGKHRVIPPDDYDYILRKIHHKRQDAYYAESTSQYGANQDQPRSAAEQLKHSILTKKHQQSSPRSMQRPTGSPAKTYLDSLNLPGVHHERSTSQLSTESSRELEQYFVVGKQKNPNSAHSLPYDLENEQENKILPAQQYQVQSEQKQMPSVDYDNQISTPTNTSRPQSGQPLERRDLQREADIIRNGTTVTDVIKEAGITTVLSDVNQGDEQWLSVQDKLNMFEQSGQKPSNLVKSANEPYFHSKPPMPKREDFVAEPSQWNYNTSYSPDPVNIQQSSRSSRGETSQPWSDQKQERITQPAIPDRLTPLSDRGIEQHRPTSAQMRSQPQSPQKEKYGLMFRLTPQGAIASISPQSTVSPSPSLNGQTPVQMEQVQQQNQGHAKFQRPLSSSHLDYNPDRQIYESEQVQDDKCRLPYREVGQQHSLRNESPRDWRSQEDFHKLKDGIQHREKHATPYRGDNLDRDRLGPSKTPPQPTQSMNRYDHQNGMRSPPVQWDPRTQQGYYSAERHHGQPVYQNQPPPGVHGQPAPRPASGTWSDGRRSEPHRDHQRESHHQGQYRQEFLHSPDKEQSRSTQKSWSTRIHEVESMRPPSHLDQPETKPEVARSFAIVAVSDKGRERNGSQKVPYKSYDEKVKQYCETQQLDPNKESIASSQYEEHVKRSQEKYRAQKHASVDSERPIYPPGMHKTEYVDPTFIRQRKTSSDSNQSSSIQNIQITSRANQQLQQTNKPIDQNRSYGLQIQVEKGEPRKQASEICVKLSRSREDLREDKPAVNVSTIKDKLLADTCDKRPDNSHKQELENIWDRHDRKVSSIQSEVFSAKENTIPMYKSYSTSSAAGGDEDNDERLLNYVSYKDGQARKRSNIYDVLTDLERTYEQLDLDNENLLSGAERREYVSHIMSKSLPDADRKFLIPENTEPNVKRLSITNLKKLEDLQKEQDANPSLEYAKRWIEEDKGRVIPSDEPNSVKNSSDRNTEIIPPPPPSESDTSACKYSSLPRKVKDDMAFRRRNQNRSSSTNSHPADLPASTTMSYLAKSPTVSPSQSMESLVRRSGRTPDPACDDLMYRNLTQRGKSPTTPDRELAALKSPTTTDYLNERTTEPARGRMRLRPEKQADKYHDDLAYRKLRQDIAPVIAELPDAYYKMKRSDGTPRHRTGSLDRISGDRKSRENKRNNQPLERSQSLGPTQRISAERRSSLSKGIAQMVDHFSYTQSAPDLTEQSIFAESYNDQGDLVSDDPRYSKYAQKPKKQQTPRTVKLRHEMKSKKRQVKHSADSGYMEQSESDASHSSSDPQNRSPPDGNFDSDDHDLRLSDTSSDKEVAKDISRLKAQFTTTAIPIEHLASTDKSRTISADALSQIKFIDDGDEMNGNNNNNHSITKSATTLQPSQNLPHHTFVFKLPDNQQQQSSHPDLQHEKQHKQWPGEAVQGQQQPRYHPQFSAPKRYKQKEDIQKPTSQEDQQKYIAEPHAQYQNQIPQKSSKNYTVHPDQLDRQTYIEQQKFIQHQQNKPSYQNQQMMKIHSEQKEAHVPQKTTHSEQQNNWKHKYHSDQKQTHVKQQKLPHEYSQSRNVPQQWKSTPAYLQDIPAAASLFQAKRQQYNVPQHVHQQQQPRIPAQRVDQPYCQQDYQQQKYQQKQQYSHGQSQQIHQPQVETHYSAHQQPKDQQQPNKQQNQPPPSQPAREPYYPMQSKSRSPPQFRHMDVGKQVSKPAPPARVSSLIQDINHQGDFVQMRHQKTRPHSDLRHQPLPVDRSSWHGTTDQMPGTSNQKVEIIQPATIETRNSCDMDSYIRAADRRSWHDPQISQDGKQVKLEFAFQAPEVSQNSKPASPLRNSAPVGKNIPDILQQGPAVQQQPSSMPSIQQPRHAPNQQSMIPGVASPPQPTYAAPQMQSRPHPPITSSMSAPSIRPNAEASKSAQAKFELPVIHSRPKNNSIGFSQGPVSPNQSFAEKPSYTVEPIVKRAAPAKSVMIDEIKTEVNQRPANVTLAGKTETQTSKPTEVIAPKSPKSQHIQLRDVTRVIKDPTGNKPPSQLRTTQIQVVTSTVLPRETPTSEEKPSKVTNLTATQTNLNEPIKTTEQTPAEKTETSTSKPSGVSVLKATEVPMVKVTKFNNEKKESINDNKKASSTHMVIKQTSSALSKHETTLTERGTDSRPERLIKSGLPPLRLPHKGSYHPPASTLSPPSASALSPLERAKKLSPAERGFILSPPPRRAGLDHFELSDGEMTDATDITLDGLVRSNIYRPSSPETLDFSDFCDNVSDAGSDNTLPRDQSNLLLPPLSRSKKIVTSASSSHREQETCRTTSGLMSTRTVTTTAHSSSSQSQEIISSTKALSQTEEEDQNLSFRDLIKSFEAKANPFLRINQDSQKSASTEELPREVTVSVQEQRRTTRDLKQISGSDPNLFKGEPQSPSWRRL